MVWITTHIYQLQCRDIILFKTYTYSSLAVSAASFATSVCTHNTRRPCTIDQ